MARRVRIPLLADLILTSDPDEIRQLADHVALDRGFRPRGPLLNRVLAQRVKAALSIQGRPLPSAQMRDDAVRQQTAEKLTLMFRPGNWDAGTVALLAAQIRSIRGRPAGELAQEVVGKVFDPDYTASHETWQAANIVEAHLRSWNPVARLFRALTGALPRAQSTLSRASGGDAGAVHGTGIAVHNLELSLNRMQAAWADEILRARLTPEEAALRAITAPRTVLRAGADHVDTLCGPVRPFTLVALNTREAADKGMDRNLAFLGSSWSRCPAEKWVMALLAEVWRQAGDAP